MMRKRPPDLAYSLHRLRVENDVPPQELNPQRIRPVVVPALIAAACFLVGYSVLHWLLVLQTGWLTLDAEWRWFLLPALLSIVCIAIVLRPRFRWRDWPGNKGVAIAYFATWLLFAIPTCAAQLWLDAFAGPTLHLVSPREYDPAVRARFFRFDEAALNHAKTRRVFRSETLRRPRGWQMTVQLLCPLQHPADHGQSGTPPVWYVESFSRTLPGESSDETKRNARTELLAEAEQEFATRSARSHPYFKRVEPGTPLRGVRSAIDTEGQPGAMATALLLSDPSAALHRGGGVLLGWSVGTFALSAAGWITLGARARRRTPDYEIYLRQAGMHRS